MKRFRVVGPVGMTAVTTNPEVIPFFKVQEGLGKNVMEVYELNEDGTLAIGAKWQFALSPEQARATPVVIFGEKSVQVKAGDVFSLECGYELLSFPAWMVFEGAYTLPVETLCRVYGPSLGGLLNHKPGTGARKLTKALAHVKIDHPEWWKQVPDEHCTVGEEVTNEFLKKIKPLLALMMVK